MPSGWDGARGARLRLPSVMAGVFRWLVGRAGRAASAPLVLSRTGMLSAALRTTGPGIRSSGLAGPALARGPRLPRVKIIPQASSSLRHNACFIAGLIVAD